MRDTRIWEGSGFSLLEILVAVMILAVGLTIILQLFSGGLKAGSLTGNYTRALFHAQNKMEEILLRDRLEDNELNGNINDQFSWTAVIELIQPEEEIGKQRGLDLFNVSVGVTWKEGGSVKHVDLDTIAIAEKISPAS